MAKFTKGTIVGIIGGIGVALTALITGVVTAKNKDAEEDETEVDREEVEVEAVEDEAE